MFETLAGYSVANLKLRDVYSDSSLRIPAPTCVTQDGVDTQMFAPAKRRTGARRRPVIGWVGNSLWGAPADDTKGLRSVLRPAFDLLHRGGYQFEELVVDRADGYVPHVAMPAIYNRMDVLVVASSIEGTPNPLLEAMATGIAVVTTDVGIAREALGPEQSEFIVPERSIQAFVDKLRILIDDPVLVRRLGDENRASVMAWDWSARALAYGELFDSALDARRD